MNEKCHCWCHKDYGKHHAWNLLDRCCDSAAIYVPDVPVGHEPMPKDYVSRFRFEKVQEALREAQAEVERLKKAMMRGPLRKRLDKAELLLRDAASIPGMVDSHEWQDAYNAFLEDQ